MPLPKIALPRDTATLSDGSVVEYRALSRSEAMALGRMVDDPDAAEVHMLACGTGEDPDAVRAWRDTTPVRDVDVLIEGIGVISGIRPTKGKSADPQA